MDGGAAGRSVSRARLAESSVVAEELAVVGVVGELGVVLERAEDGHHELVAQQYLVDGGVIEQERPLEDVVQVVEVGARLEVLDGGEEADERRQVVAAQQRLHQLAAAEERHVGQRVGDRRQVAHLGRRQRQRVVARDGAAAAAERGAAAAAAVAVARRLVARAALQPADLLPQLGAAVRVLEREGVVDARVGLVPRYYGVLLPLVDVLHVDLRLQQRRLGVLLRHHYDKRGVLRRHVLNFGVPGAAIVPLPVVVQEVNLGAIERL